MTIDDRGPVPAGGFSTWLRDMQAAIEGERDADVACGSCTACCTSSQFVHIAPDEVDALAHIPKALRFPAPHLPRGHVVLGYDERGHCPMLVDGACSIYDHRPRTCRTYDCRVFPAADVTPDDDKPLIVQRAARWVFDHATERDEREHLAVRRAATAISRGRDELPPGSVPHVSTQIAVVAVQVHDLFLDGDEPEVGTLLDRLAALRR
ncbi:MAG: YkgJ family cysteine cluster protein [Acidimicrobiia bacterium]